MNHKCPICSEEFNTLDVFDKHIENHKDESILNEIPKHNHETPINHKVSPEIDLEKIFDKEKFEKLTEYKINKITDLDELISRRNFIEQTKEIYQKNPFCYIPNFVKNLMDGYAAGKLQEEFHFHNHLELQNTVRHILGFKEDRYRLAQYPNAFELNLQIIGWKKKYDNLQNNFNYFKNELIKLFFENVLQAYLVLLLMDDYMERHQIYQRCLELKSNYSLFRFIDKSLEGEFNNLLDKNLENMVDSILSELISQKIIYFKNTDTKKLKSTLNMEDIKKNIKKQLELNDNVLTQGSLETLINQDFPVLKLIPDMKIFDTSLDDLYQQNIIHKEQRSMRENDFQIFLSDDFKKIESDIKYLENTGNIPFKGRKITPERFVSELLELEKGDFDDQDDQVTRIAGLVLAESVALQSIPEKIKEFDFTMNITDYQFRPDQLEAMAKLNFRIDSQIFHIKVMIDEILHLKTYENLKEKLPLDEQGVIITFKKIPPNVKKIIENDSKIQIIDEEGIKIWVSITSKLPARINSISKIYADPLSKLENKIVKVNSVFYEKGIAIVNVFPKMNEATVLVRSLEEISLFESHPSDFQLFSKNYFEFLQTLSVLTTDDDWNLGFFENTFEDKPLNSKIEFELKFNYSTVNLNLLQHDKQDIFKCNCLRYAENQLQFCSHLVSALDHVFRYFLFGKSEHSNPMKKALKLLIQENMVTILDRLGIELDDEDLYGDQRVLDFISGTILTKKSS
jgi:hypothetical protein